MKHESISLRWTISDNVPVNVWAWKWFSHLIVTHDNYNDSSHEISIFSSWLCCLNAKESQTSDAWSGRIKSEHILPGNRAVWHALRLHWARKMRAWRKCVIYFGALRQWLVLSPLCSLAVTVNGVFNTLLEKLSSCNNFGKFGALRADVNIFPNDVSEVAVYVLNKEPNYGYLDEL